MKKVLVWTLVLLMLFCLTACGEHTPKENDSANVRALRALVKAAYAAPAAPFVDDAGEWQYTGTQTCYLQRDGVSFTVGEKGDYAFIESDEWEGDGNAQYSPICLKINMKTGNIVETHPPVSD